jgi:hypothetical protein
MNNNNEIVDVIELGEDGCFDITSTKPIKQPEPVFQKIIIEDEEDSDEETPKEEKNNVTDLLIKPEDFQDGQYKMYQNDKSGNIILKLKSNERVSQLEHDGEVFVVQTNEKTKYKIQLPPSVYQVKKNSIQAKVWNDFVSFRFEME